MPPKRKAAAARKKAPAKEDVKKAKSGTNGMPTCEGNSLCITKATRECRVCNKFLCDSCV